MLPILATLEPANHRSICETEHLASGQATEGWVTLFDGTRLDHWHQIGDAHWRLEDGVVVADKGSGFLVS